MKIEHLHKIYQARLQDASDPNGLSEGDIVILEDSSRKRIGHIYSDGSFQLTTSSGFFCSKDEFFLDKPFLGKVHLSNGGLECSIEAKLEYIGVEDAHCWTWRETPCAGGGMDLSVPFRVFKIKSSK